MSYSYHSHKKFVISCDDVLTELIKTLWYTLTILTDFKKGHWNEKIKQSTATFCKGCSLLLYYNLNQYQTTEHSKFVNYKYTVFNYDLPSLQSK